MYLNIENINIKPHLPEIFRCLKLENIRRVSNKLARLLV